MDLQYLILHQVQKDIEQKSQEKNYKQALALKCWPLSVKIILSYGPLCYLCSFSGGDLTSTWQMKEMGHETP